MDILGVYSIVISTQSISIEMEAIRPNEKTGIKINRGNDYRGLGRTTQST